MKKIYIIAFGALLLMVLLALPVLAQEIQHAPISGRALMPDAAVVGANGVTADAGLAMVFGTQATANHAPVVYRIGGIVTASPPTVVTNGIGALEQLLGEIFAEFVVEEEPVVAAEAIQEVIETASQPEPPPKPDDFNADGTRKKSTADTIVTEGEVCK